MVLVEEIGSLTPDLQLIAQLCPAAVPSGSTVQYLNYCVASNDLRPSSTPERCALRRENDDQPASNNLVAWLLGIVLNSFLWAVQPQIWGRLAQHRFTEPLAVDAAWGSSFMNQKT